MGALLPLLADAAPAIVSGFAVGAARGAGGIVGKAAGQAVVDTAGSIANTVGGIGSSITNFFSPPNSQQNGQQRVILMTQNGPIY